jgi:energy-coupling factor transport system ATP-binding protein
VKLHDGTPREIFSHVDTLKGLGLDVPVASEIAFKLNAKGYEVGKSIINNEELAKGLKGSKLGKQLSAIHSTDAPRGEGTH